MLSNIISKELGFAPDKVNRTIALLDDGATSFYETELGWRDFDCAGSLCHGWSALPVYYYTKLCEHKTF